MSAAQIEHALDEEQKLWRAAEAAKCDPLPLRILADYLDEIGDPGAGPLRVLAERRRFPLKMVRQELGEGFYSNTVYLRDYWGWTCDRPGNDRPWYLPRSYYLRLKGCHKVTGLCAAGGVGTTYRARRDYASALSMAVMAMLGCPRTLKHTTFRDPPKVEEWKQRWVDLRVAVVGTERDFSFWVRLSDGESEIFIPKSQMRDPYAVQDGDRDVTISVTEWFAKKKGLL